MIISISGNDGSGKSTTIVNLKNWFNKNSDLEIEVREEFNYFLLKYLMRFLGSGNISKLRNNYLEEKKSHNASIIGKLWSILVCVDLFLEYYYLKFNGYYENKIYILDRSIFDFYISWDYLGVNTTASKFFVKYFPSYDLSVVLYVDPIIAYKRKKETHSYPISFYELQTKRYLNLKKIQKKLIYINTNNKLEETSRILKKEILFKYFKNFSIDSKNIKLFQVFVNNFLPKDFDVLQNKLKIKRLTKEQLNIFTQNSNIKIIKKFEIPANIESKIEENDIDVYQPFKVDDLKNKLEKINLKYSEEPGRISFDLGNVEIDVHTALSFWNVDFVIPSISEKKSNEHYLEEDNELLIYIAHSVYKHGLIEKGDLLSGIRLINNKDVDLKKCLNDASTIKWDNGFLYFLKFLNLSIIKNELTEKRIPLFKYLYFWLIQYIKNDKASFSSVIIGHYAYLRNRYNLFNSVFSALRDNSLFKKISSSFGFRYAK